MIDVIEGDPADEPGIRALALLTETLGGPVVVVGGLGVRWCLRLGRIRGRATQDVDVLLRAAQRPASRRLAHRGFVQDDHDHSARIEVGLVPVDLLSDGPDGATTVVDEDGLVLVVPTWAGVLESSARPVTLRRDDVEVEILLPRAGALLASKVGTLGLEDRASEKRLTDASDAALLAATFGALALADDLETLTTAERQHLAEQLDALSAGTVHRLAGLAGWSTDLPTLQSTFDRLALLLRR